MPRFECGLDIRIGGNDGRATSYLAIRVNPFEAAREKDIVGVIGRDVRLRKSGHVHKGLCPFHDDYEPSLVVYQDSFYCFGCGVGGTVIDYVMQREQCSPLEAARRLIGGSFLSYVRRPARQKMVAPVVPRWILKYWHGKLLVGRRSYFSGRRFTDEIIDKLMLGWDGSRYVIPIWEKPPGTFVHQVARRRDDSSDDEGPKYLVLPGRGGHHLLGAWLLDSNPQTVYVCFGVLTWATFFQDGFSVCSPSNGLAWSQEWNRLFQSAEKVWIVGDNTPSERDQTWAVASAIGGHAQVVQTPSGYSDYNEYRREHSREEFLDYLGQFDKKGK